MENVITFSAINRVTYIPVSRTVPVYFSCLKHLFSLALIPDKIVPVCTWNSMGILAIRQVSENVK